MQDTIELYRAPSAWMAKSSGPHAKQILNLFGTDTLPTPFTAEADAIEVLAQIQQLNPDKRVYLREERS